MPIALHGQDLVFEFPDLHPDAVLRISFMRTLRVPDDDREYPLPPGLGRFPLRPVDDLDPAVLPPAWKRRGGLAMPMWQAEACWLSFSSPRRYPFALKIAAGKVNAVNGRPWADALDFDDQDHVEVPGQPWLDGFCVTKGKVRQFVAMPLGAGYTAEEQVTGRAEHGGIQLLAHPLKPAIWEAREAERRRLEAEWRAKMPPPPNAFAEMEDMAFSMPRMASMDMGLAPGGAIRQEIAKLKEAPDAWDLGTRARCFVHLAHAEAWPALAGAPAHNRPPRAADYARAGLPWFEWYAERPAKEGAAALAGLRSVAALAAAKGDAGALPENEGFEPPEPIRLGPAAQRDARLEGFW